ncbi:hypothetical protein DRE_01365 [Drechslerella stenobrocha 248]|uniref:PHD-type domain-containing protein n=1 Tax=Drechslerella stenobrocha 248 TaxID=1043628 RepID=W7HVV9_9PEZI|nr:hypothetical protein DRE_01365 [Drechslerella stenobrocha 248]
MRSTRQSTLNSIVGTTASSVSAPAAGPPSASSQSSSKPPLPAGASQQLQQHHPSSSASLHQQWEFAAVWQFLFQFHTGLKSPHYDDIEQFATDISSPSGTPLLHDVQIGLLKNVSSQRGLTIEMFDDYARRQYLAKNPKANPFGADALPLSFYSLSPENRVRVLHQLCMWIISKPEAFRDKIDPHKLLDQTDWRIDPIGWDSKGTTYYQFDNGYLYCRTEPPPPVYKKWKNKKPVGGRSVKRRKLSGEEEDGAEEEITLPMTENDIFASQIGWKCVCGNIEEYKALSAKFEKSKHLDETELRKVILEDILPVLEKDEQKRRRKLLEEEKELARLLLLSGRKRSARVDERAAKQREAEEREQALRREREENERHEREEQNQHKEEEARLAKLEEREKRLQERETRAKLREEERARLLDPDATESDGGKSHGGRKSSRQKEKRKAELETEDKDWVFDCVCGTHGLNYDDGSYSIACDKCGVWQHTECLGLPKPAAEENEFVCDRCRNKQHVTPIKIKLRLTRPMSSEEDGEDGKKSNGGLHNDTNSTNSGTGINLQESSTQDNAEPLSATAHTDPFENAKLTPPQVPTTTQQQSEPMPVSIQ